MMAGILTLAFVTELIMAKTANLGGQIRHSEIRNTATNQDTGDQENSEEEKEEH